jgi:hypothetical protein
MADPEQDDIAAIRELASTCRKVTHHEGCHREHWGCAILWLIEERERLQAAVRGWEELLTRRAGRQVEGSENERGEG